MNDTFVITGDRGFVGGRLRNQLLQEGHQVIGLGRTPAVAELPGYQPLVVDLSDRGAVLAVAEKLRSAKAVFHLAARNPGGDDDPVGPHLAGNLQSAENLLEALDGAAAPLVLKLNVVGLRVASAAVARGRRSVAAADRGLRAVEVGRRVCGRANGSGRPRRLHRAPLSGRLRPRLFRGRHRTLCQSGVCRETGLALRPRLAAPRLCACRQRRGRQPAGRRGRTALGWGRCHISGGCPMRLVEVARLVVEAAGHGTVETNDRPALRFRLRYFPRRAELGYRPPPLRQRIGEYIAELRQNATQRSA